MRDIILTIINTHLSMLRTFLKLGLLFLAAKLVLHVVPSDGSSTCKEVVGAGTRPPVQIGSIGTAMSVRAQKSYIDDGFLANDDFPLAQISKGGLVSSSHWAEKKIYSHGIFNMKGNLLISTDGVDVLLLARFK